MCLLGARTSNSVGNSVNVLVVGSIDNDGQGNDIDIDEDGHHSVKCKKARQLGINIWTENEWLAIVQPQSNTTTTMR